MERGYHHNRSHKRGPSPTQPGYAEIKKPRPANASQNQPNHEWHRHPDRPYDSYRRDDYLERSQDRFASHVAGLNVQDRYRNGMW